MLNILHWKYGEGKTFFRSLSPSGTVLLAPESTFLAQPSGPCEHRCVSGVTDSRSLREGQSPGISGEVIPRPFSPTPSELARRETRPSSFLLPGIQAPFS